MCSYESSPKRRKTENKGAVFLKVRYYPGIHSNNMTYSNNEHMMQSSHHLPNFHHQRFEPVTQSTLSTYTSHSDGGRYPRKQHFQYGRASGGSASNHLIYGNSDSKSANSLHSKDIIPKYYETPNDSFLYEKAYTEYLQEKEITKRKRDEQKRKDLDELRTYKAPWGKPGGGAPKDVHNRTRELNKLDQDKEQIFPFGNPGGGAPLRAANGAIKAGLPANPDIRFQKRAREQIHDVINPLNSPRRGPLVTNLDILAQESREKRHVVKREKDMSTSVYDPFGRPGAGAPLRDDQGRTKVGRTTNLSKLGHDSAGSGKSRNQTFPFGPTSNRGGNGAPLIDDEGRLVTEIKQTIGHEDQSLNDRNEPWGRGGAGAPIRDESGKIITQVKGRLDHDTNSLRQNGDSESKQLYLQMLRNQVAEQERLIRQAKEYESNSGEDTSSWMRRGVVGQPHYDPNTNEIIRIPRHTSDIVRHRLDYQHLPSDKERSREYHEQLDEHFRNMKRKEEEEKRMEREKSFEHARTMESMWGKTENKPDPRRRKVSFAGETTPNDYGNDSTTKQPDHVTNNVTAFSHNQHSNINEHVTVAIETKQPEKKAYMSEAMKRKLMSLQHSSCL